MTDPARTDLLVGVDVGTTRLKVGVFNATGERVAAAGRDCAPEYRPDGRVELDSDTWWTAFQDAFEECLVGVERAAVRAVAVSSQAQTYVVLDAEGRPLGPAVSWLDATGNAEDVAREMPLDDYYAHTGFAAPMPFAAATKLRRRSERPNPWRNAAHVLFPAGYLIFRLTGRAAAGRNLAAMSGLHSMIRNGWWPEAVDAARTPRELLPRIFEMGAAVDELDASSAGRWGLGRVVVAAGANDQTAAALGAGLHAPGQVTLGVGTALVAYQVIEADAPALDWRPLRGPYPGGYHYQLGLTSTACATVEWTRDLLAPGLSWDEFYAEALSVEPGAAGLRLVPDFIDETGKGGVLAGLGLGHERKHIFRAALEGVACAAREQLDRLDASGQVLATGGGTLNNGFMQTIADVADRPIDRVELADAGLWGTALMAGHAAGIFVNMLDAARDLRGPTRAFRPSQARAGACEQLYADYLRLKRSR